MIDESLWQAIAQQLPAYLDRQRWYADKLRPIARLDIVDSATVTRDDIHIMLAILGIEYQSGDARRYFVPMTMHHSPTPERATIGTATVEGTRYWIQDAVTDALFRDLLVAAGAGMILSGRHGEFSFEPWTLDGLPYAIDPVTQSATTDFEQSNSSITYGQQAIAKIYRRLEAGQNIEVDMNRYLGSESGFAAIPRLIAAATYRGQHGELPLLLVQQHVGDHRDAWSALTDLLRHRAEGSLDIVRGLGRVTGEMHVALASAVEPSPMTPELIGTPDTQRWREAFLESARETDGITAERLSSLPERSRRAARDYLAHPRDWQQQAEWFRELEGLYKTRVHGDYHLGQILVTRDGRLLVVDFEGEPHRPAHERAAKYSPLRDVAGMLRSLNYATGVVASSQDVQPEAASRAWLDRWEQEARHLYLSTYRRAIADAPVPIAPAQDDGFTRAVQVLETDKALYEVRYELNSRPDWVWLPIDSLL